MTFWVEYIQDNYRFFDLLIKTMAAIGALVSVSIAVASLKVTARKNKYELLTEFHKDFLSPEIVAERDQVAAFWSKQFSPPDVDAGAAVTLMSIGAVSNASSLARMQDCDAAKFVESVFGVRITTIDSEFVSAADNKACIALTEKVLNRYENLAKLVEAGAVSRKDIRIFFYTMMADTFVVCLPYILYRRQSKANYAHKMQALLKVLPRLSNRWMRV